jgi:hypothetical protein
MVFTSKGEQNWLCDESPSCMSLIKSSGTRIERVLTNGSSSRSKKSEMRCEIRPSPATDVHGLAGTLMRLPARASASILATSVAVALPPSASPSLPSFKFESGSIRRASSASLSGNEERRRKSSLITSFSRSSSSFSRSSVLDVCFRSAMRETAPGLTGYSHTSLRLTQASQGGHWPAALRLLDFAAGLLHWKCLGCCQGPACGGSGGKRGERHLYLFLLAFEAREFVLLSLFSFLFPRSDGSMGPCPG